MPRAYGAGTLHKLGACGADTWFFSLGRAASPGTATESAGSSVRSS